MGDKEKPLQNEQTSLKIAFGKVRAEASGVGAVYGLIIAAVIVYFTR